MEKINFLFGLQRDSYSRKSLLFEFSDLKGEKSNQRDKSWIVSEFCEYSVILKKGDGIHGNYIVGFCQQFRLFFVVEIIILAFFTEFALERLITKIIFLNFNIRSKYRGFRITESQLTLRRFCLSVYSEGFGGVPPP